MSKIPRLAVAVLRRLIHDPVALEGLLGDLEERHGREAGSPRWRRAFWMWRETTSAMVRYACRGRKHGGTVRPRAGFLEALGQDLRVSWRQFSKRPAFVAMAVLILGLGIGASTTMFSVVNGVLLDPLPYPDSERLVHIGTARRGGPPSTTTSREFLALRRGMGSLESFAAFQYVTVNALFGGRPEQFTAAEVTVDYAEVFRISPSLGRSFSEDDHSADAIPVAILSHHVWLQNWGGDPGVLGSEIRLARRNAPEASTHTIVGVMPPSFRSLADIWTPIRLEGTHWEFEEWRFGSFVFTAIGRLNPHSSLAEARAEAVAISSSLAAEYPQHFSGRFNEGRTIGVTPLLTQVVGGERSHILLLFGAAAVLLAIAMANLTGLLLARGLDRRQEIAVRYALGAGRSRVFRHLLTEAMSISFLGGGVGFCLALIGTRALRTLAPIGFPRVENLTPDVRVFAVSLCTALVAGLISGAASLPSTARGRSASSPQSMDRIGSRRGVANLRGFLVSFQVALAVVLLFGAGLLFSTLSNLQEVDPGTRTEGLLIMPIRLTGSYDTEERYTAFFRDVVRQIGAIPGVMSASWVPDPPIFGRNMSSPVRTEETLAEETPPVLGVHPVGFDYFPTMGIPVTEGRGIVAADDAGRPPVAVVDKLAARQLWSSESPLGKRIFASDKWFTVVGVVGSVHQRSLATEPQPEVYLSALQHRVRFSLNRVVIRSSAPLGTLAPALREAVWEVDPSVPVPSIEPVQARIAAHLREPRFNLFLMSAFSLSALFLALAGIYGLMSYWVTMRTREIGLRMALGARAGQVLWATSRQGLRLVLFGLVIGLGLAAASARLLDALLFGVPALDLPTFGMVAGGVGAIALLACMLPALRGTRIEPMRALRWG
jgi:predicted permease